MASERTKRKLNEKKKTYSSPFFGLVRAEEGRNRIYREKVQLLSRFPGDWTVGFQRGKKQSYSPRQGLRVGTVFGEFRQTPKGRGFLLLDLILV